MRDRLFEASAQILGVAFLIAIGFAVVSALFSDGRQAVLVIGGLFHPEKMPQAQILAFWIDSAFALFYGAGLICLTASFSRRSNRPLTRILILAILILAICDFSENRLIMDGFANEEGRSPITSVITHVKYSLVALIAIGLSVLIPPVPGFHKTLAMLLRIPFPLLISALIVYGGDDTGFGKIIGILVSLSFLFMLASLSWVAWTQHKKAEANP